jgi:hypothetical protein
MTTLMLEPVTTLFPAHWRHTTDNTVCEAGHECPANTRYVTYGAWLHQNDDTPCDTPLTCSRIGRDAYLHRPVTIQ